jgi:hypothetical protein
MITVKLISNAVRPMEWLRYFPKGEPQWGNCRFTFDRETRNYDWLVVYDDIPPSAGSDKYHAHEQLACPQAQTLLVTTEPSSIKCYGKDYTAQFGYVLTSQEPWALPHPNRIYSQPALRWFYGVGSSHIRTLDEMINNPPFNKTRLISAASSSKRQRHTLHYRRYQLVRHLKERIPELDVFGHGIRAMDDKAEALDSYRYHIAIENHIGLHHWTEKLSDAFLGLTVPFYCGAPNAADYFPPESFIPISIKDPEGCFRLITEAVKSNEYQRRLPFIQEARSLVLFKYNLMAVLSEHIGSIGVNSSGSKCRLRSRHTLRREAPGIAIRHFAEKAAVRAKSWLNR